MYQKILVPLDGSELAECVLPHVEAIAKGCGVGSVVFVRVIEPAPISRVYTEYSFNEEEMKKLESEHIKAAKGYMDRVVGQIKYGKASVKSEVLAGPVSESIADYATEKGIDLIVIATHGRSGISRWGWGSVADRVLRSACVPVLMVRAPGCVPGL